MDSEKIRVLVIDDDDIDREAVERYVRKNDLPYDIKTASSKLEAFDMLQNCDFDIILLDYNLGTATGFEVLPDTGDIPVIFITGSGSEEIAVEAMRKGAYDYLIKDPYRNYLTVLSVTIKNVLKRRNAEKALQEKVVELKKAGEEREKLIAELREALAEVKVLGGLLPICGYCKKVRDDKGYWQQIENYIESHSQAKFTHSMCNSCLKKNHPDIFERLIKKGKITE